MYRRTRSAKPVTVATPSVDSERLISDATATLRVDSSGCPAKFTAMRSRTTYIA